MCQEHIYIWLYIVIYTHIYIVYTHLNGVHEMTSQHNYSQEADVRYTKLTKLQYNDTQLLCGGLQRQPSYFATR